jgi:transposase InsO family protein
MLVMESRKELPREGGHKLYKRIRPKLQQMGIKVGRDMLFTFLGNEGLLVKPKKSFVKTTNSYHRFYIYSNLISSNVPRGINQVWVSDITYVQTHQGFMYLALITDAYSRKIVGYDISKSLELCGCMRALKMALRQLPKGHQLIHHSDRGIQYCSNAYIELLKQNKVQISMAAKGNCHENAMAERVNGILKDEFYLDQNFKTTDIAIKYTRQAVNLYNNVRTHMAIGYVTPNEKHNNAA